MIVGGMSHRRTVLVPTRPTIRLALSGPGPASASGRQAASCLEPLWRLGPSALVAVRGPDDDDRAGGVLCHLCGDRPHR